MDVSSMALINADKLCLSAFLFAAIFYSTADLFMVHVFNLSHLRDLMPPTILIAAKLISLSQTCIAKMDCFQINSEICEVNHSWLRGS